MLLARNLLYWLILVVSLVAMFPFLLLGALIPNGAFWVGQQWVKVLMWSLKNVVGLKYRLVGAENIPDRPSIICAKHQSGWETLALQEIFPHQVFVAKRELFKIPFFGWGLKIVKTIGIERGSAQASAQLAKQGKARRDEGYWITIFPEGTRVPPGSRGRYKSGAARMAKLFEMDMVPVALNSGEFWPKNSFLKYPGTVDVIVGPVIRYDSGSETELIRRCEEWIEARQLEINGKGPMARPTP